MVIQRSALYAAANIKIMKNSCNETAAIHEQALLTVHLLMSCPGYIVLYTVSLIAGFTPNIIALRPGLTCSFSFQSIQDANFNAFEWLVNSNRFPQIACSSFLSPEATVWLLFWET